MPRSTSKAHQLAEKLVRENQPLPPAEALQLAGELKAQQQFGSARSILRLGWNACTHDAAEWTELTRQYALCTYKDVDLPPSERYDQALEILRAVGDLGTTLDAETLGLAGAIFKGKWEWYNQKSDLERSLGYYLRGAHSPTDKDGYAAINAAYILDLLASEELREAANSGAVSASAQQRQLASRDLRENLDQRFTDAERAGTLKENWWVLVTWAEARFGLRRYEGAAELLDRARRLPDVETWQMQATVRQLVALSELQTTFVRNVDAVRIEAHRAIAALLVHFPGAIENASIGSIGLALSGGGFRASLFHIGVLARLAECDMLRHVDVISCVSGGSILGTHYYLELRNLLRTKEDGEITRKDYIDIVHRLETEFLAGVQKNLRMQAFFSLPHNLIAAMQPQHTITDYIGDLYEKELYGRIQDGEAGGPRYLSNLYIQPKGEPEGYHPRRDNWRRRHKVPMLVLNATSLNTGHNWQFTASWMGEPPAGVNTQVDANYRLRRMYYDSPELTQQYQRFRLGRAVAASACVPGLFDPVALKDLYPGIIVQLVDGGVHDNQGVSSLLDEGCNVLIVSDASGQMGCDDKPGAGILAVPLRANSILQARVREAQFEDLSARRRSLLLRGMVYLHLKKDLAGEAISWIGNNEPQQCAGKKEEDLQTEYGIDKQLQRELAAIRTDLDSFNQAEAYALMFSGYRMAAHYLPDLRIDPADVQPLDWDFLRVRSVMTAGRDGSDYARLTKLLRVGRRLAFKPWSLAPGTCATTAALVIGAITILAWLLGFRLGENYSRAFHGVGKLLFGNVLPGWSVIAILAVVFLAVKSARLRRAVMAILMIPGSVLGWLYLRVFDSLYLNAGSLRFIDGGKTAQAPSATETEENGHAKAKQSASSLHRH